MAASSAGEAILAEIINRSEASLPTSQICSSPLQSLHLFTSISTTTSSDSDNKQLSSSANRQASFAVVRFFEDCDFSQIQAESIVSRYPKFLRCDNPEQTLKPKIDFLHSIGIPEADVAKMVTRSPIVIYRSLNDHRIPSFDSLKNLLGGEHNALSSVKRCPSILNCNPDALAAKLSTLRKHGVPESNILKMMNSSHFTGALDSKPEWFSKIVDFVMKMGFDTSSISFCTAIAVMGLSNESTWEDKLKFYQGLGFFREQIFCMFRKNPGSLWLSQKKVREAKEIDRRQTNLFLVLHVLPSNRFWFLDLVFA